MTTAANAINSFVEVGTITPGYAALRAHRPLQGRLASRKALMASTVLAGTFGLLAAEATAQQYNLPGSGGFTDVSSSINVVTDAGGGNIRVVLADGVQFFAGPGQYQLNPMTSSLQVATDLLLTAYTGAAPLAGQQTQQAFSASQAQAYATPTVYPSNAALTLGANQYATQASVVGGYQMQPTYSQPVPNYGAQGSQYVPAYSAGAAGYGMGPVPSYASYGGAGTAYSTFGGMQPSSVTTAVPSNQMAMAPSVPAAAAVSGGMFGIPTWALVGGGVALGGAALLAAGSLTGGSTSAAAGTGSNLSISQQQFLSNPEVQAALNGTSAGSQSTGGSSSSGSSGSSGSTTTTTSGGVTVTGGSTGSGSSTSTTTSSYTVPAGSSGQTITGSAADDTVIFADGGNVENIGSIDLKGGTGDRVILKAVDENLDIPDLNNVEYLDIELAADNLEIDLQDIGTEAENVMVDANGSHNFTVLNTDAVSKVTVKDGDNESAIIKSVADQTTIALENSEDLTVEMKSGSDNELTVSVSAVTDADVVLDGNVDDLTITSTGSAPNVIANLRATAATVLEINGAQDLEIEEVVGSADLTAVKTIEAAASDGDLTLTLDGTKIEKVTLGDGGDDLTIDDVLDADAEVSTGDGNDDVTINKMVNSGTVNTGAGADDIVLNDALGAGEKIDGGSGTNDEITLNVAVTAGTVTNVETINIQAGVSVDFDNFTGETDVNIVTTGQVTIDKLVTSQVDTIANASLVITDMVSGAAASFDAAGSLTIESNDSSLTDLTVDMTTGSTLTLTADATNDAITDVTLTSAGNITLAGSHVAAVKDVDASGVVGTMTVTANDFAALTSYLGAAGVDNIEVDDVTGTANIDLKGGDDVFTSTLDSTGTLIINGGAGKDTFNLDNTNTNDVNIINVTTLSDMKVTAIANAAALTAALSAQAYEVVTNFATGTDEFNMDDMGLSNISTVQTSVAAAYTQLATNDVVILNDTLADLDGDTATDDYFVIVDTAGDNSSVGIFKIDSAAIAAADIDIV